MTRILVVGGGGYIGTTLVPALLEAGFYVRVFDRFYFGDDFFDETLERYGDELELVRGDIRVIESQVFDGIDICVDLAAISNDPTCELNPRLTREINHLGALRVGRIASESGVDRHIFASSCSVYGHGRKLGLTERSETHPRTLYAECKLQTEKQLLELGETTDLDVVVFRFATVFGLSARMRFDLAVNLMTKRAYTDGRIDICGGGKQWRPFVHVKDVARAIITASQIDSERVAQRRFNVGSNELNYQIEHLAYKIRDLLPGTEVEHVPTDPDVRTYNVAFDRIRDELDFQPRYGIDDGVQEIAEALANGTLNPNERRWVTLKQYQFLREVEQTYARLVIDGTILDRAVEDHSDPPTNSRQESVDTVSLD